MLGIEKSQVDHIREIMRANPKSVGKDLISDEMIDKIAIIGNPEQCRERMTALMEAGADLFGLRPSLEILERFDYEKLIHQLWSAVR